MLRFGLEFKVDYFIEFSSFGLIYDKSNILQRLPATTDQVKFVMSDFPIKILSEDVALTTFKTERTINEEVLVSLWSSLWRRENYS